MDDVEDEGGDEMIQNMDRPPVNEFPVVLEELGEITADNGEKFAEVLQEFSRARFPDRHLIVPNHLRNAHNTREHKGIGAGKTIKFVMPSELKDKLREVFTRAAETHADELKSGTTKLTETDIPALRDRWMEISKDIMSGVPETMPPLRAVNHRIPLIDDNKVYNYHLPRCPDAMKEQLIEKINRYVRAGWWTAVQTNQAAPMLCIPKKTGLLRTAIDCRKRNDNTLKDVTPFPDQDQIRMDCARAKYRSKIDMSDAYEQIRVVAEDVWKTAFTTVYGTFVSHTMQIGDCNAPATFQRIMTMVFQEFIGRFVHVYLDDIFIYSNSIDDHEKHLKLVFDTLRTNHFYLKKEKCDLYSKSMDCLGHLIDDRGLHADADKMQRIRDWREPRSYHDIQRFLGLVQYLSQFLPDITAFTGPLAAMTRNGNPFFWHPMHQACFDNIKIICCRTAILRPIDPSSDEPIWVICDASCSGLGAMYGQGPTWQTCRPAGFMSKKFTSAQHNYRVFEQETLAILEALLKWEDKLMGYRIHVVTDHKALEFFKTQRQLSGRQTRWMEYLSRFDFDIRYIKGELNKGADCLSRYYENDTWDETHDIQDYVNADIRLDPEMDDIPFDRLREVEQMNNMLAEQERLTTIRMALGGIPDAPPRRSARLQKNLEPRDVEVLEMEAAAEPSVVLEREKIPTDDPTVFHSRKRTDILEAPPVVEDELLKAIRSQYKDDKFFKKLLNDPSAFAMFVHRDGLIYSHNRGGEEVLCVPEGMLGEKSIRGSLTEQAHLALGHFGPQRTGDYLRRWYWWPGISAEVKIFCDSCATCLANKPGTQVPAGKLHSLPIPTKPWESISMDFLGPFPKSKGCDYLWVIMCRFTSNVHLIPIKTTTRATELSHIFIREIVRLHGLPSSIVSDRDSKFTSAWWREVHRLLGAKLLMSTAFHPQTDGATERMNRSVGQILRSIVAHDQKDWLDKLALVEFAINASISAATGYAPFELVGGYMPAMLREFTTKSRAPQGVKAFAEQALLNLAEAHDAIIEARVFSTIQANKHRRDDPPIKVGDLVYLATKNLALPKGRAGKLLPRFVGPYRVQKTFVGCSDYELELPEVLASRRVHNRFHISLLRPHVANNDVLFPNRDQPGPYDFGAPADDEWLVSSILAHRWTDNVIEFHVKWNLGDTTWEKFNSVKLLSALDDYFELHGVKRWQQLPKRPKESR
jgi:hypothetical protein